jgi:hypothetical protein
MIASLIHIDHVLNFGASPAPGLWRRVTDAFMKILHHHSVKSVIKWVDDFVFLQYSIQ